MTNFYFSELLQNLILAEISSKFVRRAYLKWMNKNGANNVVTLDEYINKFIVEM